MSVEVKVNDISRINSSTRTQTQAMTATPVTFRPTHLRLINILQQRKGKDRKWPILGTTR